MKQRYKVEAIRYTIDAIYAILIIVFSIAFIKAMYRSDKVARKVVDVCHKVDVPVNSETNSILGWKYVKILGD